MVAGGDCLGPFRRMVAEHRVDLDDSLVTLPLEVVAQLVGGGEEAGGGGGAVAVARIDDAQKPGGLAFLDALDAGADVGAVGAVERTMERPARYRLARRREPRLHDRMPMRALDQVGEMALPDPVVVAKKLRDHPVVGLELGVIRVHLTLPLQSPCSFPRRASLAGLYRRQKRTKREIAARNRRF